MKNLKSSRLVKTLCFILCFIFTVGVAGNVILGLVLSESNLFYAEKEQMTEIAFEKIVEHYHQTDIRRYVMNAVTDGDTQNRDTELYQTKFSRGKSNLSFTVKNADGNIILSNDPADSKGYTFTKTLQIYDYDYDYAGMEWTEHTTTPPETTEMPEATDLPAASDEDVTEPTAAPETTAGDEHTTTPPETRTAAEDAAASPAPTMDRSEPVNEPTAPQRTEHVYMLDDNDYGHRFRYYYYGEQYSETILQYCLQIYEAQPDDCPYATHTDGWVTFREEDFALSDNGVVYYKGDSEPTTYIADFNEEDFPHTDYTVTYTLPVDFTARDLFYYAQKLAGFAYGYIHKIIPLTVCFALASLLFFILSMLCAGHVKGENEPKARALHRVPYDIVLLAGFCVVFPILYEIADESFNPIGVVIGLSAVAFALFWLIETTVVRCKAKTIGKNFIAVWLVKLAVRFVRFMTALFKKASGNMNLLWKLGLIFAGSVVAEFIYSLLLFEEEAFIFLWVIVKLLEIPLLLWLAACWNRLQKGARNLSEGHITEKVATDHLFGEFRKNADYLNAISDGVNKEVRERMKSESMKTELITNVSHDLKTPLTSIINYVDLLKGTDVTDPKAREYIDVIDRQSQRLKKLCADVVDASKAATGAMHVTKEPTTLNVMLTQAVGEYDERLKARRLQLVAEIPAEPISVSADGKLLWRVFDNLMNNICKYAMEGSRVYLTLSARDGAASVMFRNISGAALNITPEELTERFVRGDASRNTEGSGLGLSISKSLTELMGGAFTVAIDGDLFKVTLTFPLLM